MREGDLTWGGGGGGGGGELFGISEVYNQGHQIAKTGGIISRT